MNEVSRAELNGLGIRVSKVESKSFVQAEKNKNMCAAITTNTSDIKELTKIVNRIVVKMALISSGVIALSETVKHLIK